VLRKFVRVAPVLNLHVGGRIIGTTAEHPFFVEGKGWTPAFDLTIGDRVLLEDGQYLGVEGVADSGRVETVYNIEVEGDHTYFVGEQTWGWAVWSHNSNYGDGAWHSLMGGTRIRKVGDKWWKEVDPSRGSLWQWYARKSLDRQIRGLEKLGNMAVEFNVIGAGRGIRLVTKDAGRFTGSWLDVRKSWVRGSWRMKNPFNDIRRGNMGAGGRIFDPALPAGGVFVKGGLVFVSLGGGAWFIYFYCMTRISWARNLDVSPYGRQCHPYPAFQHIQ